jgi:hypothetical protein
MYRIGFLVAVALIGPAKGASAALAEESFYCVAESSGGIMYDANSKNWRGAVFSAKSKFVLNVQTLDSKYEGSSLVEKLNITVTLNGSSYASPCYDLRETGAGIVVRDGSILCVANATQYIFNRRNNRFLSTYAVGYVDGADSNEDTPNVMGGTCTKIK